MKFKLLLALNIFCLIDAAQAAEKLKSDKLCVFSKKNAQNYKKELIKTAASKFLDFTDFRDRLFYQRLLKKDIVLLNYKGYTFLTSKITKLYNKIDSLMDEIINELNIDFANEDEYAEFKTDLIPQENKELREFCKELYRTKTLLSIDVLITIIMFFHKSSRYELNDVLPTINKMQSLLDQLINIVEFIKEIK